MKRHITILIIILISFSLTHAQNFRLWNGDTINRTDKDNFKQGKWIFFEEAMENMQCEGDFINDKKIGVWKSYYTSGNLQSEITYKANKRNGFARIYYENGNIAEEGTWVVNKWVGEYKSYFKNGQPSYVWNYNKSGQRSGCQKYFHENGKVKIEGEWNQGKETGVIKEYYETGDIKTEKSFTGGACDTESIKTYENKTFDTKTQDDPIPEENKINETNVTDDNKAKDEKVVRYFSGTGQHIFYTKNRQPYKEGYFENGALKNGKQYFYDDSGKLIKTAIFKNGKFVKYIENK